VSWSVARCLSDSCRASCCAQSLTRKLEAFVYNNVSPVIRRRDKQQENVTTVKSNTEPKRHKSPANLHHQRPVLLTSSGFRAVFTQHQLDTALYGHDMCNIPTNQATVGPALSGLRPTGLSYGTYIRLCTQYKSDKSYKLI